MTSDELKALPIGRFIVTKTGVHPMQTKLELFFKWGITFDVPFEIKEKSSQKVEYASADKLKAAILEKYSRANKPNTNQSPPSPIKKEADQAEEKPPVRGA